MDFWFYKSGELTNKIKIAKIEDNKIVAVEENFTFYKQHKKALQHKYHKQSQVLVN